MMRSTRMMLRIVGVAATMATLAPAAAQNGVTRAPPASLLLRVEGDATLPRGEEAGAVVVLEGDARVSGTAGSVVVVNGTARLDGARVGDVTVVNGTAVLGRGTTVGGTVHLVGSTVVRSPDVVVRGGVAHTTLYRFTSSVWLFGLALAIGVWAAILAAALLAVAVAERGLREAGEVIVREPGQALMGAAVLWLVVPPAAVGAMFTIIGIPLGSGLLLFVLPALGFAGYLVAGCRLGEIVMPAGSGRASPWRRALLGTGILLLMGGIPGVGGLVTLAATLAGSGALAVVLWRRGRPAAPAPARPAERAEHRQREKALAHGR